MSHTEHFIPVSRFAVLDLLQRDSEETERAALGDMLQQLSAWRHEQFHHLLLELKSLYLPFSPDRDTKQVLQYDEAQMQAREQQLVAQLTQLLLDANYQPITREDLNRIFTAQSPHGLQLHVDLSEFSQVLLFSRGSGTDIRQRREWRSLFLRPVSYEVPIYQRLFLLLKLKPESLRISELMQQDGTDEQHARRKLKKLRRTLPLTVSSDHIYLKLFKRIPTIDLEMLFPNTRVQLKLFDKIRLGVTAGGGTVGSIVATATKLTAAANPMTAAGALGGLAAVVFRQVSKFFTQRTKYMMLLAQRLYFHNLANNRGVLTLMVDRAEEEEIKESCLLYHELYRYGPVHVAEVAKLQARTEAMLRREFDINIRFDWQHPLAQLQRDGLIRQIGEQLEALPPSEAAARLALLRRQALQSRSHNTVAERVMEDTV